MGVRLRLLLFRDSLKASIEHADWFAAIPHGRFAVSESCERHRDCQSAIDFNHKLEPPEIWKMIGKLRVCLVFPGCVIVS